MAYSTNLTKEQEKQLAKKKVEKALTKISTDVVSVFDNKEFPEFLKFAARFHYFDINNVLLIYKQRPTATFVASFKTWEKFSIDNWGDVNRPVFSSSQKGKGIGILVPYILKKRGSGQQASKTVKSKAISYFDYHVVFVFDKEQTNNIPAPVISWDLSENPNDCEAVFNAFKSKAPFKVGFSNKELNCNYTFNESGDGSPSKDVLLINTNDKGDYYKLCGYIVKLFVLKFLKNIEKKYSSNDFQMIVECVSYMICCYFGLSTEQFVFFFAKTWGNKPSEDLIVLLNSIQNAAHSIIEVIEEEAVFLKSMYGNDRNDFTDDDSFLFNDLFNSF